MTIIKTKQFILRPLRLTDAKRYFESNSDPVAKKGFMGTPKTLNDAKKEIVEKQIALKNKTGETFAIESNGVYLGFVEISHLTNNPFHKHKAEIGYCMHPDSRGKGITTAAVKIVTAYAFKKYHLKRISGWCRTFNKASARVLEKSGYTLEGILRKNKIKDGKYVDDMVWAKVK